MLHKHDSLFTEEKIWIRNRIRGNRLLNLIDFFHVVDAYLCVVFDRLTSKSTAHR